LIDLDALGFPEVFDATAEALARLHPVFEAAFTPGDALALADMLLRRRRSEHFLRLPHVARSQITRLRPN